jgi:hypothetical protein
MTNPCDPEPCECPECDCVKPLDKWWTYPNVTSCNFVVDPGLAVIFNGTVYAQVRECDSQTTTTVIDVDDAWVVDIHLTVGGQLIDLFCGYWCISVCLESMCGDNDYRFPQDATSPPGYCCCLLDIDQGTTDYDTAICVPADIVAESECGAPYELTVIVTTLKEECINKDGDRCDPGNHKPLGIATACEVPLMMFYKGI